MSWIQDALNHYFAGRLNDAIEVYRAAIAAGASNENIHGNLAAHLQDLGQ